MKSNLDNLMEDALKENIGKMKKDPLNSVLLRKTNKISADLA